MKVPQSAIALLGMAIWWLLLFLLWMGWLGPISIVAAIIALFVISLRFRDHPQIVAIWFPLMAFAGLSTLAAVWCVSVALWVRTGYHPQSLFGSLSAVMFMLTAILVAVAGIVPAVILFFSVRHPPQSFPEPQCSLAILNTLALCAFIAIYHQTLFIFERDPMIVHVLDSQDKPLSQVTVHYANFTTQPDGETEPESEESGTLITDDGGTIKLSPNYQARHVVLDLSKDGYEKIKAMLVNDDVGEGDQGYRVIHIQLNGRQEDAAQTYVSNKHPIEMKLYLPTDKEAPSPEQEVNFGGSWPSSGEIYLKLSDGTLTEAPDGDLKFEIIEKATPNEPRQHFKVTALNGASLTPYHSLRADSAQGIRNESFKFDDMMSLAPSDRYTDTLMIDLLNEFYYRSKDGKQYARIEVSDLGSYQPPYKKGPKGKLFLWTIN